MLGRLVWWSMRFDLCVDLGQTLRRDGHRNGNQRRWANGVERFRTDSDGSVQSTARRWNPTASRAASVDGYGQSLGGRVNTRREQLGVYVALIGLSIAIQLIAWHIAWGLAYVAAAALVSVFLGCAGAALRWTVSATLMAMGVAVLCDLIGEVVSSYFTGFEMFAPSTAVSSWDQIASLPVQLVLQLAMCFSAYVVTKAQVLTHSNTADKTLIGSSRGVIGDDARGA